MSDGSEIKISASKWRVLKGPVHSWKIMRDISEVPITVLEEVSKDGEELFNELGASQDMLQTSGAGLSGIDGWKM